MDKKEPGEPDEPKRKLVHKIIKPDEIQIKQSSDTHCVFVMTTPAPENILYSFEMKIETLVNFVAQFKGEKPLKGKRRHNPPHPLQGN